MEGYFGLLAGVTFPVTANVSGEWWYIWLMVTTRDISPEDFKARRILAHHKQDSLAMALNCSSKTIRNYERRRTTRLYSVRWGDLARELKLPA